MNEKLKVGLIVFGNMFLMSLLLTDIALYSRFKGMFMYYLLAFAGVIIAIYFMAYTILKQVEFLQDEKIQN